MITSKTSFLALIGNPVRHSLSPIMQNAALKYLGLDLIYISIPCEDKDLELVLNSLKRINCKGLNITIPHKQKALDLCNEVSPIAKKLKAVNTLKLNLNREWSATNTDVDGFTYPLKSIDLKTNQSIVLGSGGAARSVIQGLIDLNFSRIAVISRKKESLNEIIGNFEDQIQIQGFVNSENQINDLLPYGENFWKPLTSKTIVYDLIYNPSPTPLLKFCKKKGCLTIDGMQMLIAQGAKSLSFWTNGLEAPYEIMQDALKEYL